MLIKKQQLEMPVGPDTVFLSHPKLPLTSLGFQDAQQMWGLAHLMHNYPDMSS